MPGHIRAISGQVAGAEVGTSPANGTSMYDPGDFLVSK